MMKTLKRGAAALAVLAVTATIAWADYPADGNITFVIPYGPGGGFDTIVRSYAPTLGKILGTTVVPKNVPGASGDRGGQAVYRADPDGYTIGVFNVPGVTVSQVTNRNIGFPLDKITWIANLAAEKYAVAVKSDSPIKTIADLCALGRPAKLSDTGVNSTSSIASVIAFNILDCPISNVTGYSGSNATMIAVMRGEVDATLKPVSSLAKYVKSGDLRMIFTLSDKEIVDGVQSAGDIGHPELAKFTINRVVGGPPGLDPAIVAKLSDAFKAATESAAITDWASSSGVSLDFKDAAETGAMMEDLSTFYAKYKDLLAK